MRRVLRVFAFVVFVRGRDVPNDFARLEDGSFFWHNGRKQQRHAAVDFDFGFLRELGLGRKHLYIHLYI